MKDIFAKYELIVRPKNRTAADEYIHNNNVWIEGREGSNFVIDIVNNTYARALFIVSVDGLDVLSGQPAGPTSNGYVVNALSKVSIPGWKLNSTSAAEFYFSSKKLSYAEKTKSRTNVSNTGVIGAMIFEELTSSQPLIKHSTTAHFNSSTYNDYQNFNIGSISSSIDYSQQQQNFNNVKPRAWSDKNLSLNSAASYSSTETNSILSTSSLGTGFGDQISWNTSSTQFTKVSSAPTSVLIMYYDSAKNLEKMGVIVNKKRYNSNIYSAFPNWSPGCIPPDDWD